MLNTKLKNKKELSLADIISANLQYLASINNLNEAEIARRIDCPPQTLNRMFRGMMPDPKISMVKRLADLFNVSTSTLISSEMTSNVYIEMKTLPIIEWSELANASSLSKLVKTTKRGWCPASKNTSKKSFFLQISSTLQTKYQKGTLFLVEPKTTPQGGDTLIIKHQKSKTYSAMQLLTDGPSWRLLSLMDKNNFIDFCHQEHAVIGVVIEKRFIIPR